VYGPVPGKLPLAAGDCCNMAYGRNLATATPGAAI
jgi:hypothetical protein